jgi:hypothetical protein
MNEKLRKELNSLLWKNIDIGGGERSMKVSLYQDLEDFINQKLTEQRREIIDGIKQELSLWRPWFYQGEVISERDKQDILNIVSKYEK